MQYWLIKSEPDVWSIDQQIKAGIKGAAWDGVRNYQAANNLKNMGEGDLCFFYHSNIGKEIVGIVEVIKTAFIDPTDKKKRFVAVKVRFKSKLKMAVSLENIKKNKNLKFERILSKACEGADLIIINTEWDEFKSIDFKKMVKKSSFKIYDMRNLYNPTELKKRNLKYFSVGR